MSRRRHWWPEVAMIEKPILHYRQLHTRSLEGRHPFRHKVIEATVKLKREGIALNKKFDEVFRSFFSLASQ